jgi:predicted ATPase
VITHLSIHNFRSLKQVDVPLRALTVLLGPNDTGKSSFIDAIWRFGNDRSEFDVRDRWRLSEDPCVRIDATIVANDQEWSVNVVDVPKGQRRIFNQDRAEAIATLRPIERFRLPALGVELACDGYNNAEIALLPLGETGDRTAALLDHLLRTDRRRFDCFVKNLKDLIPGLKDVGNPTPTPNRRAVHFEFEGGLKFDGSTVSAGIRLCTFFAALAWHPRPPKTILIEEPENGVHPKRLGDVMALLRGLSRGEFGEAPSQVILTTHSPYLLDHVNATEEQVLVFGRESDGSCTAQPINEQRIKQFLDEFMLGEIWTNEQEKGLIQEPAK